MNSSSIFSRRRMRHLFRDDGRCVLVAMDHGAAIAVHPGLTDVPQILRAVIAGGADAILTTPGIVRQFSSDLKSLGVILRVDGGTTDPHARPECKLLYTVEDALRLSADAVACMGFPLRSLECQTLANVAALAGECQAWDVPLLAEMLPGGFVDLSLRTTENIRLAARLGAELGADIIKTEYTETAGTFHLVTEHCYRPLLVLGGSKQTDERGLLLMVQKAMEAGAAGIAIGRNIWSHAHPQAMVMALSRMVHENASVEDGLEAIASASR